MKNAVILIDFDNVFYGNEINEGKVRSQIAAFIDYIKKEKFGLEKIEVRLYGGWRSNSSYTQKADQIHGMVELLNSELFPVLIDKRRIYGDIRLVTSMYGLEYVWENTFQEKRGIHRLKVKQTNERMCSDDQARCPVQIIANATKCKDVVCPVNGCDYVDFSHLVRMEQKMVDTMISCDILEYTKDNDYCLVIVVSNDVDLHPALALAGAKYLKEDSCHILLFVGNSQKCKDYNNILHNYHIKVEKWD